VAGCALHDHPVVLQRPHAPDAGTQHEHIAGTRLEDKLFIQRADLRPAVRQVHIVGARIRNRASVRESQEPRAGQRGQAIGRPIPRDARSQRSVPWTTEGLEPAGNHEQNRFPCTEREVTIGIGAAHQVIECAAVPLVDGNRSDDLLSEDIERVRRRPRRLYGTVEHPANHGRGLNQVLLVGGIDTSLAGLADQVTRAAHALQALGDTARRLQLHHQVDRTDIDAQFEGAS